MPVNPQFSGPALDGLARVGWGSRRGSDILRVDPNRLTLRCLSTYTFTPAQVVAVERIDSGWFDGGVRILHNRADYPRRMAFWCHGGADEVLRRMAGVGFVPNGTGATGRPPWIGPGRALIALLVVYTIVSIAFRLLR